MANIFDNIALLAANATLNVFGYDAVWTPVAGTGPVSGRVFYNDRKGSAKLGEVKYGVDEWRVEFKDSDFPGLKNSVNKNVKEPISVTVRGVVLNFRGTIANSLTDGMMSEVILKQVTS